jgi:hypothetical protein
MMLAMLDPETTALALTASQNLPPVVKSSFWTALSQLVGSVASVPIAWLDSKAKRIRAEGDAYAGMIEAIGLEGAKQLPLDAAVLERAKNATLNRAYRSQNNREAVGKHAANALVDNLPANDASCDIDPDWLDMFSRIAEQKSNAEMQRLFGHLLAGEIRQPGSFSPATVEVLARLTAGLANDFSELCCITSTFTTKAEGTSSPHVITAPYGDPGTNALAPLGFSYSRLCALRDAGLLQADLDASWSIEADDLPTMTVACVQHRMKFTGASPAQVKDPLEFRCINLTRAGSELLTLVEGVANEAYVEKWYEWFEGAVVRYGLVIERGSRN